MTSSSGTPFRSLEIMANRLRRHSLLATSEAGSGHPTSCFSCAEIMSVLFFAHLRFDVKNPASRKNDRFILSKGHAAPILWAAWAEAGAFTTEELTTLRKFNSKIEGHPTPLNPYVDVATGSLGQGLSAGAGMALASKIDGIDNHTYVLIGDGEMAEGAISEAMALARYYRLSNLTAIVDINRLGQSGVTMYGHNIDAYAERFQAEDWLVETVNGHDVEELDNALHRAHETSERPVAILARTFKGKGVSTLSDQENKHGKPLNNVDIEQALKEIGDNLELEEILELKKPRNNISAIKRLNELDEEHGKRKVAPPEYSRGEKVATRQAYGTGLTKIGTAYPRVLALDGDVKNSTYAEIFEKEHPQRFIECFIAEQNMVGMATGLSALGKIPFVSTFACFFSRAYDFIRMAGISQSNIKLCGSHAGVSIGEDGPSQMGLEDIAMMRAIPHSTVLYPSDAVSTERLVELATQKIGLCYIRTTRSKTNVIYSDNEEFHIGGSKTVKTSNKDQLTIVGAGITLHEAIKAHEILKEEGIYARVIDLYSVKPLDVDSLRRAASETGHIITVEDHYPEGGIGEAVLMALANQPCRFKQLAVNGIPKSGDGNLLLKHFEINAGSIVKTAKQLLDQNG